MSGEFPFLLMSGESSVRRIEIAGKVMSKWVSAQPTKDKPPLGLRHSQSEVAANSPENRDVRSPAAAVSDP
eukprot:COSAG02_NODE_2050_length_10003_cov_585.950525_3_plen_71_part_00